MAAKGLSRTTEQALAESVADLRGLLERLPEGVVVHRQGRVLFVNLEFLRLVGRERPDDIVGSSIIDLVHPDDRAWLTQRIAKQDRTSMRSHRHRLLRADGPPIVIEVTALPMMFEGQLAFVAICHDVTEKARLEERLATAERLASLGRLASGVGHEINNPLAYMLGSLELANAKLASLALDDGVGLLKQHLDTVREGAERIRGIVRDLKLLTVSGDDRLGPVDVGHAVDVATATLEHEIRPRARLVLEHGARQPVLASLGRLVQVFVNLLMNAAQAIPEGDASSNEIRVTTRDEREWVIVEIRDTGAGIAPRDLPRIFEPFFTTKTSGVGTGLGLSISHQIVTTYGGTLTAEAVSPGGALFRVTLPSSDAVLAQAPQQAVRGAASRARVLLVEDDPAGAHVLAQLLGGHEVTLAGSGREAIARVSADGAFDAIVCDLQMSDGNGVDLYEHLLARVPELARRTIFMTGGAFTDRARRFLDTCPQPVLDKPFDPARLEALIDEMARSELPISAAPRRSD